MSNEGTFNGIFQRRGILNGKGVSKVGHQIYPNPQEQTDKKSKENESKEKHE